LRRQPRREAENAAGLDCRQLVALTDQRQRFQLRQEIATNLKRVGWAPGRHLAACAPSFARDPRISIHRNSPAAESLAAGVNTSHRADMQVRGSHVNHPEAEPRNRRRAAFSIRLMI
jgi:hypothetical protein